MIARNDIGSDLRAMLARRADDIDPTTLAVPDVADLDLLRLAADAPLDPRRSAHRRSLGVIAVGAIAALVVIVVAMRANDDAPREVNAGVPKASPLDTLPVGFDPKTAGAFFTLDGTAEEIATAYLRDRLHAISSHDLRVQAMATSDDVVTVPWTTVGTSGFVMLRRDGSSWAVIAASTDGIDLSGVVRQNGRVQGVVRGSGLLPTRQAMSADVLGLDARPVPAAPFPQGVPGAEYLYATAARGYAPELPIDIAVPDEPVVVRIHLVGGVLLSVSEVRFDSAAASAPSTTAASGAVRVMPDVVGQSFVALGDAGRLTQLEERGPLRIRWIANDSAPPGVVIQQVPAAGQLLSGPVQLWVSVGGPIVALNSLGTADREVARRIGIVDDSEPIQMIETTAGAAFKIDAYLFAADCKSVDLAYRRSIDPSYQSVCSSEPSRMLGL